MTANIRYRRLLQSPGGVMIRAPWRFVVETNRLGVAAEEKQMKRNCYGGWGRYEEVKSVRQSMRLPEKLYNARDISQFVLR